MAQVINTNVTSLNAQRRLNDSQKVLGQAMGRLSSGMRINSAKDDAAGLAISNRMTSQIKGLDQASRNAGDAISMSQVAEGALQETTNILQRMRELSIQSANASNTSTDRASLQAEVDQLQKEISRIAETTSFNGKNLLDGSFTNSSFHIGSEEGQNISVSIKDMQPDAMGASEVTTDNADGMAAATAYTVYNSTDGAAAGTDLGTEIGNLVAGDTVNGYSATTLQVSHTDENGALQVSSIAVAGNEEADTTAAALDALDGVTATGFNQVTISNLADNFTAGETISVDTGAGAVVGFTSNTDVTMADFAANLVAGGVNAVLSDDGSSIDIFSTGEDINITTSAATTVDAAGLDGAVAATVSGTDTDTFGGRVDIQVELGMTVSEEGAGAGGYMAAAATGVTTGHTDATNGNNVAAQTVTIANADGTTAVTVAENDSAFDIAENINQESDATGVTADATTSLTMSALDTDGTVSFSLQGDNDTAVTISATVTTTDLQALTDAINDQASETGITAAINNDSDEIELSLASGRDIQITDFTHSAAVDVGDASGTAAVATSMTVTGSATGSAAVTLNDGGSLTSYDSALVGGELTFSSSNTFTVSSDSDGRGVDAANTGSSLFANRADQVNSSSLNSIEDVDITTVDGANDALKVIDAALAQVDEVRGDLGAVQNRFESTISNLSNVSENMSVARSAVRDADFAKETSDLARGQILSQASTAMLAQANASKQNVMQLLG